ncbi:beta-lactamase family protein [Pseudoflavitalea sp. G-6-1-2]|uniref:serine hydrolase domain-containing protein n=1 Tax=Pseudoflavitalea sp. G-6-1-2 TaxID=2728841 RepID=UPI00146EA76D|nr:serine hydrolase domain-containing protein [Pseudoflavitalea sp. G-6-1-2]NML19237.1 beta-lactamase family protein [Pseudoflavitalea sp. G-6-1-2]
MPHSIACYRRFFIFLLFVLFAFQSYSQKDKIDTWLEQQMQQQKIVGLTIGIVKNGKLYKTKSYGMANLEQNLPAGNETVYKLASVSKQMVAAGTMLLIQEGKLRLTDPMTRYFKDAPEAWNGITIRHLLNHTSGLQRESPAFDGNTIQSDSVLIRAAYKDTMLFATGSKWVYCNLGYFMLADIIRQLSGKSFTSYMQQLVFDKYGLTSTQPTSTRKIVPHRAGGYERRGGDTILNAEEITAFRPSGAFISNIGDMLKWEMMMQQSQLLTKQNWQKLWSDTVFTGAKRPDGTKVYYGYGWNVSKYQNRNVVFHAGSLPGFRSAFYRFPDENTAIIILTNSEPVNINPLALGVADILFEK